MSIYSNIPLKNKTVLLAGATGLAGSSLIEHIVAKFPHVFIRGVYQETRPFLEHKRISYIRADLTDRKECQRAARGCDFAIMAAASTGGAAATAVAPNRQVTDNIVMDATMFEAMHCEGISRIVYLSSATVYQEFNGYIKEKDLDWNKNPHPSYLGVGWAKRAMEKIGQFWHEKYAMDVIIVRCANIYGPYANFNPAVSNFIPAIIRKAVDKMDPFEVWGRADVVRDVICAGDLAAAVMLLLSRQDIKHDVFNLGGGKTVTVGEVVDLALKHAGHSPSKIVYAKEAPTTIPFRALDSQKIQKTLSWQPVYPIDEGIRITTRWWIKNKQRWNK
jgi:GDP-L-fucose synthase